MDKKERRAHCTPEQECRHQDDGESDQENLVDLPAAELGVEGSPAEGVIVDVEIVLRAFGERRQGEKAEDRRKWPENVRLDRRPVAAAKVETDVAVARIARVEAQAGIDQPRERDEEERSPEKS